MADLAVVKAPSDINLERMTLEKATALATQKPEVAGSLIMALATRNTDMLPGTSFVRREDGVFLKKLRTTVRLTESEGTLIRLGKKKAPDGSYVNAYDLSIHGYRKLNILPAIQIIRPEHVTVDGQKQMNPYIQVDPETKMPEVVYARCLAVGYSPSGSLTATDVMVRLDINIYLLENIQSKLKKATTQKDRDLIGIYGSKNEPPVDQDDKPIRGYHFFPIHSVGGIGLWVNLKSMAIQEILSDHTTRLKFIERLAQSFSERNALKAHPAMPKGIDCSDGVALVQVTGWTTDFNRDALKDLQTMVEEDRLQDFRDGMIDVQAREVITEMDETSTVDMNEEASTEQVNEGGKEQEGDQEVEPADPTNTELLAKVMEKYGRLVDLRGRKGAAVVLEELEIENIEETKPELLTKLLAKIKEIEDSE